MKHFLRFLLALAVLVVIYAILFMYGGMPDGA
jgi:hypothetical protein